MLKGMSVFPHFCILLHAPFSNFAPLARAKDFAEINYVLNAEIMQIRDLHTLSICRLQTPAKKRKGDKGIYSVQLKLKRKTTLYKGSI